MTAGRANQFFGPTKPGERIEVLDVIRGYSLWGVLLINMMNFGALVDGLWIDAANEFAYWAKNFFFEQKSWRLFSFMFGLGFAVQMGRAEEKNVPFLPVYLRRLLVLLVIGRIQLLVYGSILDVYAWLGLALVFFRRASSKTLLVFAVMFMMVFPTDVYLSRVHRERAPPDPATATEVRRQSALVEAANTDRLEAARRIRAHGSVLDFLAMRSEGIVRGALPSFQLEAYRHSESMLAMFPLFLLGLYIGKRRILHNLEHHRGFVRRVLWWGLGLGLAASVSGWLIPYQQVDPVMWFARETVWVFGASALSFFYAALITEVFRRPWGRRILKPLGAVGRTALSNYVMQTILFAIVFQGFGFGGFLRLGPAPIFGIALIIYVILLVLSVTWLRYFLFGPLEWVWRSATYLKLQPLRRRTASVSDAVAA